MFGRVARNRGVKMSEETRLKMSLAKKGKISPTKGMKRSDIVGDKHPMWKGGNSKGYKLGYYSTDYKNWRTSIFERDQYTCQDCGVQNVYLTAHHIKSFAYFPELRFELSNGKTLCEDCHSQTDNYKGRARTLHKEIIN